jgi:hypothetical protein
MSERRACRVIDADRKSVRYRSIRDDDGALREKLETRNNHGFRVATGLIAGITARGAI